MPIAKFPVTLLPVVIGLGLPSVSAAQVAESSTIENSWFYSVGEETGFGFQYWRQPGHFPVASPTERASRRWGCR